MAVSSIRAPAPDANPTMPFDPAAWLQAFKDVGGNWTIGADQRIWIGIHIDRTDTDQHRAAHAMFNEAFANQVIRPLLRAHLLQTAGGDYGRD